MHVLPGVHGHLINGANRPVTLTYVGTGTSGSDSTSYTFSSQSIGSQIDKRHILVMCHHEFSATDASGNTSAVTVGGVSASQVVAASFIDVHCSLWLVEYDNANTTADIVLTTNKTAQRAAIGVWQLTNYGIISTIGSDVAEASTTSTSISINTMSGGASLYGHTFHTSAGATPTSPLTERYDASFDSGSQKYGADDSAPSGGSIAYGATAFSANTAAVAASFR